MKEQKKNNSGMGARMKTGMIYLTLTALFIAFIMNSCEKSPVYVKSADDSLVTPDVIAPTVITVLPANNAASVATSTKATVTFSEKMNPSSITSSTITLKQGTTLIPGYVSSTGAVSMFTPSAALVPNKIYTGTVTTGVKDSSGNALVTEYTWNFTTAAIIDIQAPTIISVAPANSATAIPTNTKVNVTFSEEMNSATIGTSTITLKNGSTAVTGTVSFTGSIATFTPSAALVTNTLYTGTVTTGVKDVAGNSIAANYTWSFTTAATADVTAPTVVSVVPASNSTSIAIGSKATATFSEAMDATKINTATFTLKQGSAAIPGTVTYSGTTATFTPSAPLLGSTVYNATITTGAKDPSGNALAANYSWSFTTAVSIDVTAPTISSVLPVNNSTSIAINSKPTVTFSEAMNAGTITSSSFMMKQGSSAIAGAVSYSGSTATFTPSANLTEGTVYTCTITTGAKDAAGNPLASDYSWSFTTVAGAPAGKSFSADVVPILNLCNTCHTHPWTTSSNASTFYNNLVSDGYVKPATPTSSKIYTKINGGHPSSTVSTAQKNTILTWMTEGSKNN